MELTRKISKQLKVVFIIPTLAHGGAQRVLYEIVSHLNKQLFESHIICLERSSSPYDFSNRAIIHYLDDQKQESGPPLFRNKIFSKLITIYRLRKIFKLFDPSSILIPVMARPATAYTVLSQLFLKSRKRIIASLHTAESVSIKFNYPAYFRRKIEIFLIKIACFGADHIILHSEAIKTDLTDNYSVPEEKLSIIPNPLDVKEIRALSNQKSSLDHLITNDEMLFSHVGRLSVEKNHPLFIQALSLLKKRGYKFKAIIAGAGDQAEKIRNLIKAFACEHEIKLVGALDNPYALMAMSRALVLTSYYDASPMVLREAMVCGTAVISVDCPFGPRTILDHGKYGLLVPTADPEALADAMQRIIDDDQLFAKLKQKGIEHSNIFDCELIVKRWEKLIRSRIPSN